jgi:signal transduction histidine kinase
MHGANGVAVCTIAEKNYTVTTTVNPEGSVVVLRPICENNEIARQWVSVFTEQLRVQMTALLTAAQQIEGEVREQDEDPYGKWLAILNQSAYRLLRMTGAAELEQNLAAGGCYHPGTMDLAELCHGLEMEVAPLAKQIGLTFLYEAPGAPILTIGDADLLRRMLLGLISNAMKAVSRSGVLGLRLVLRKERAMLTVWDDGPGMDERSLGALFMEEPGGSIPRPGEGLRLGMFNARTIATLHGGVLVVESRQGEGARFTVSLPVRKPEGLPLRAPKPVFDEHGGFSPLLVELSDALPWQVFLPSELE